MYGPWQKRRRRLPENRPVHTYRELVCENNVKQHLRRSITSWQQWPFLQPSTFFWPERGPIFQKCACCDIFIVLLRLDIGLKVKNPDPEDPACPALREL